MVLACIFPFDCRHLASCRPIAWGISVAFLSVFQSPSTLDFLESLVLVGLSSHLSPRDDMIPVEGIMARPIG
jgi:hypothetical protein